MAFLIYAVVDANSEQAALDAACVTFDAVVEKCEFPVSCIAEYDLFVRPCRNRLVEQWGEKPVAVPTGSVEGELLLEEAWEATATQFTTNLEEVRSILDMYTDDEIMANADNVRNAFLRVGTFAGATVPLYQERGWAIRTRQTLDRCLEEYISPWIVPAEGRY